MPLLPCASPEPQLHFLAVASAITIGAGRPVCFGSQFPEAEAGAPGPYVQMSTGLDSTALIRSDGTLVVRSPRALPVFPATTYKKVSCAPSDSDDDLPVNLCAIRTSGTLDCSIPYVGPPPSGTFSDVCNGIAWACGLRTTGAIDCWYVHIGEQTRQH
jgi:hypothetical protein